VIHLQISKNRALGLLYVKINLGVILIILFNFPVLLIKYRYVTSVVKRAERTVLAWMRLHMTTRRGKLEKPDLHNIAAGPNTTLSWPSQGRFFGDELVTQLLQNSNFYLLAVSSCCNQQGSCSCFCPRGFLIFFYIAKGLFQTREKSIA